MVWYSYLFKSFQFVMIHTVKDFSVVSEIDLYSFSFFLEFSCFLHDLMDAGNLISGPSAFSKPRLYIWNFLVQLLLKSSLKDFQHYLASM